MNQRVESKGWGGFPQGTGRALRWPRCFGELWNRDSASLCS